MRVTKSHMAALRDAITPLDRPEVRAHYLAGDIARADRVQDLDKRYRWDLFRASGAHRLVWGWDADYADAHLDTALRAIVPPLGE